MMLDACNIKKETILIFNRYQLQNLHDMVKNVKKSVVVAGDFNVLRGDLELQLFPVATGLKNTNRTVEPSHPSRVHRRQLDYIFHWKN